MGGVYVFGNRLDDNSQEGGPPTQYAGRIKNAEEKGTN